MSLAAVALRPVRAPVVANERGVCGVIQLSAFGSAFAAHVRQSIAPGKIFVTEGDPATHFHIVISGTVTLFKLLPDGRRAIIGFRFPGEAFGLAAGDRHNCNAAATTPASVRRVPRPELDRLLLGSPGAARSLFDLMAAEIVAGQEHMLLLGRKTAQERVASFLVALSHRAERCKDWIDLPITRADIADYLGLTTETVSRVFTMIKHAGCIALAGGRFRLLDRENLLALAEGEGEMDRRVRQLA